MRSSAVAGMVFLPSQELCQMEKPMTEIELNEKIENLLTESATRQPSRRTGSAYRRGMRIRKNDALMRIVTRRYVPHAGYIDYGFDGNTLLHSGKYIKYPKNSNCQRWMKQETSRKRFGTVRIYPERGITIGAFLTTGGHFIENERVPAA